MSEESIPVAPEAEASSAAPEIKSEPPKTESVDELQARIKRLEAQNDKVILERRAAKSERDQALEQIKTSEEDKLKEKEEWKTIAETREQEVGDWKTKYEAKDKDWSNAVKLDSFLKALPGELKSQYYALVDIDKIILNPDSGQPEPTSVEKYAKEFAETFTDVFAPRVKAGLPQHASQPDSGGITIEQYRQMSSKEMKENAPQIMEFLNKQQGV